MRARGAAVLGLALASCACATLPPPSASPGPDASVLAHVPVRGFDEDRCGPGSLAVVLNALGDRVTEEAVAESIPTTRRGRVLSVDLLLAARERGLDAELVRGSTELLREEIAAGRPAILMLRLLNLPGSGADIFHYVVVDGIDPERKLFRFQFGDGEARWATMGRLDGAWKGAGRALLKMRAPEAFGEMRAAMELEAEGRFDDAADRYRAILEDHPALVRARVNLGNALLAAGRTGEAEAAYRSALEQAPRDVDALNNLAWLLYEEGTRLEEAEVLARAAASRAGHDRSAVLDTLGRILAARGRCREAEGVLDEALSLRALAPSDRAAIEGAGPEALAGCVEAR